MGNLELRECLLMDGGVESLSQKTKDAIELELTDKRKASLEKFKLLLTSQLAEVDAKITAISVKP